VLPVNKYAWSKLGGECAVRLLDGALIVRTSFGPNEFPYPKAFVDQWTSRIPVREFAEKLVQLIDSDATGVLHVGAPRRTVLEFARSISPTKDIGELSIDDVSFMVPRDTSLDTSEFDQTITR
jgi:dTDP-4-dehydrorhamnose reductase